MYVKKNSKYRCSLLVSSNNTYTINIPYRISNEIFGKKRKRISLYLIADTDNFAIADNHRAKIQDLIDNNDWEQLVRYDQQLKPKIVKGNFKLQKFDLLWEEYKQAKKDVWSESYKQNDVAEATRVLANFPDLHAYDDFSCVLFHLLDTRSPKQAKRYLKQYSAAISWAKKRGIVKDNPLPNLIASIPIERKDKDVNDINPFTRDETTRIIDAFRLGTFERYKDSHTQYADYVEVSFLTGARTSEVLGLSWNCIDFGAGTIVFKQALVLATNSNSTGVLKSGLKTQKSRIFPANEQLLKVLRNRKGKIKPSSDDDLIFDGISHSSFRGTVWKKVLKNLDIPYRKPYQMRHSFISNLANYSQIKIHQIAKICGTSIGVIEHHYLKSDVSHLILPEI